MKYLPLHIVSPFILACVLIGVQSADGTGARRIRKFTPMVTEPARFDRGLETGFDAYAFWGRALAGDIMMSMDMSISMSMSMATSGPIDADTPSEAPQEPSDSDSTVAASEATGSESGTDGDSAVGTGSGDTAEEVDGTTSKVTETSSAFPSFKMPTTAVIVAGFIAYSL